MKKKFLALVLTLAMVLSLVPVTALAVDEGAQDTPANDDVITYQAGTPKENYPEGLTTLDKQAKKIPGTDNQYEVTLTVGMRQKTETVVTSQEAATVLVIDISNSMGCTKEEHKHNELCYNQCTPKSKPEHWMNTIVGSYHKRGYDCWKDRNGDYHYTGEQTLTCTKEEHSYNDNCHTRLTDAKDAARAFVETYAGSVQDAGRKLAIVLFNCDASVALSWTDASTDKDAVLAAIDGISLGEKDDGSTNLEQGLSKAKELLSDSSLKDISKDNKNIIALTDGAPTCAYSGRNQLGDGTSGSAQINEATFTTATAVKKVASLYTVCFGAKNTKTYRGGPTVGDFLRDSIATDSSHAYNADNAGDLNEVFEEISKTITSGLSAGTVHDALPRGVTSSDANFTADWDLSSFTKTEEKNGDRTDYTYTKTYTVTINPDSVKRELFDKNNYYPLNGSTTLTVKVKENGQDIEKTLNFPIPGAKVSYTVNFDSMEGSAVASQKVNRGATAIKPDEPTRDGFVFRGWYTDRETTEAYDFGTEVTQNITLYAKWEKDGHATKELKYTVEYRVDSQTGTKLAGEEVTVNIWKNDDTYSVASVPTKTFDGYKLAETGSTALPATVRDGDTIYVIYEKDNTATKELKYTVEYRVDSQTGTKLASEEVTVSIWKNDDTYSVASVPTKTFDGYKLAETGSTALPATVRNGDTIYVIYEKKLTYTINQRFMDGEGKEISSLYAPGNSQTANKDTLLSDLIKDKTVTQNKDGKVYVYVSSKTTYTAVGEKAKPLDTTTSTLTKDTTIDLYYYLDNWKDAGEAGKDSETGGDGIPDCYQVLVNYQSGDTNRGSVGPLTMEVLTIKDATTNSPINKGKVTASGSTANATGSRCYFSNWTTNADVNTSKEPATLGQQTFTAEGGKTYTFTANFGRSSGGSNRPKPPVVEIPDDVPTGLNGKDHYAYVVGYPDGMVYPQKNITRAEVATIFFRLLTDETREANMTKSNGYNDMKDGAWYTCAVSTLSKMGIIKGYEDGSFKPDASISRAEFAAIAARFDPDGDKTPATFSDVSSHWAKDEISIAANHGWIKGYEDGSFKPDQKITRAETMTLVNRVLKRLPETKDDLHKDMKTWPDNQNESAWFYLAVQEATNSHYQKLKKDGTHETWESMRETRDWAALEK